MGTPNNGFTAVLKTLNNRKFMVETRKDGIYIRLAGKPEKGFVFSLDWWKVFDFGERTNTAIHAEQELNILSKSATDPENRPIIEPFREEILALCEKFGRSGQSGGSAPYTASSLAHAIKKLCLQEPICPLMGIDEEWGNVAEFNDRKELYQNKREGAVFKEHGTAYYLDAIIWKEENGCTYYGNAVLPTGERFHSKQNIKGFPFTPKTFYIDVVKEILPDDWTEEPYIEWDYYDTKLYELTGEKKWKKEKYRNVIKHPADLKKVWKYYNKRPA